MDLLGQGQLDEDAVDGVVVVEPVEQREELGLGRRRGQRVELAADADLGRRLLLVARVDLARGIFADEDDLEARRPAVLLRRTPRRPRRPPRGRSRRASSRRGSWRSWRAVYAELDARSAELEDAREDAVEVIEILVRDRDLALAVASSRPPRRRPSCRRAREARLEVADARPTCPARSCPSRRPCRLRLRAADERLGRAHAEASAHDLARRAPRSSPGRPRRAARARGPR